MIRGMMFSGRRRGFTLTLATSVVQPDIPALATAAGWNGASPLTVNITAPLINTLSIPASWSFPGGLTVNVSAATRIGGVFNGGTAMIVRQPITLNNAGVLSGGGGKGASGQEVYGDYYGNIYGPAAGGAGGNGQGFANASSLTVVAAQPGSPGQQACYTGESIGGPYCVTGQTGGTGGSWGMPGDNLFGAGTPGPAGNYLEGADFVTWGSAGTRLGGVTAGGYRYWRLHFDTLAAALTYVAMYEIELRATPGGPDITTPSTPGTASGSFGGGYFPDKAVDNNPGTYWASAPWNASNGAWLQFNLGSAQAVRQIALTARSSGSTSPPASFRVLGSNDNLRFSQLASFAGISGWADGQQRLFNV